MLRPTITRVHCKIHQIKSSYTRIESGLKKLKNTHMKFWWLVYSSVMWVPSAIADMLEDKFFTHQMTLSGVFFYPPHENKKDLKWHE